MVTSNLKMELEKYFNKNPKKLRTGFSFSDLYSKLGKNYSKQAIRSRVYKLIQQKKLERVPISDVAKLHKKRLIGRKTSVFFRLARS